MKKHEIFKTNPNLKQVHMTSDGQAFYNDNDAKLHAKSLEDKSVELVVNPDHIVVVDEEVEDTGAIEGTGTGEDTGAGEGTSTEAEGTSTEPKAESTEAPQKDLAKMNKSQLIEFAKLNELEIDETLTNKLMVEQIAKQLEGKK